MHWTVIRAEAARGEVLMSCLLLDFLSSFFLFMFFVSFFLSLFLFLFFLLQYVNFPNANLLVFLFPGFIVIPKPSQLSQWNSSIATIFLLLKKPCNPESDAALHPASIASFPLL